MIFCQPSYNSWWLIELKTPTNYIWYCVNPSIIFSGLQGSNTKCIWYCVSPDTVLSGLQGSNTKYIWYCVSPDTVLTGLQGSKHLVYMILCQPWYIPYWLTGPETPFAFLLIFATLLSQWDFSHGKFGLPSHGKASYERVVLSNLQCMLGVLVFP